MNSQESKLGGISSHWKTAIHLDQGVITVSYQHYSNKRSLLFDWPNQRLFICISQSYLRLEQN